MKNMIHFQLKNENMEVSDSPHGHVGSWHHSVMDDHGLVFRFTGQAMVTTRDP